MSDQQQPASRNKGDFTISGGTFNSGGGILSFGHGNQNINIVKSASEDGKPTIDVETLKQTLLDLHKSLESAPLSEDAKTDAQVAAKQARKAVEGQQDINTEALVGHIKEIGDTLQSAGTTIKSGSQVALSVMKIASIVGPLVAGGAKVVASWFGVPLP